MLRYEVVEPNIDINMDKRYNKAKKRNTLYRDEKSKPHRTINGKGIIAKLYNKK